MSDATEKSLTPLMEQYTAIKEQYKDCLLMFRLGDFYEMFWNDAILASKTLDIVLTHRGKNSDGSSIPMCGIPYHAYESYIGKLIKNGFKIAICEQLESPTDAKKRGAGAIVKRDVVRIITPGTLTEDSFLQSDDNNYLMSVYKNLSNKNGNWIASWIDISTSDFYIKSWQNQSDFEAFLYQLYPSEIVIPDDFYNEKLFAKTKSVFNKKVSFRPSFGYVFDNHTSDYVAQNLGVKDVKSIADFSNDELICIKALIDYIQLTNKCKNISFKNLKKESASDELFMDEFTFKSLEIIDPLNQNTERFSTLFSVIKETCSNAGTRLLKNLITKPITNIEKINERLDAIEFFVNNQSVINLIQTELKKIPDIQRILSRILFNRSGPRDLYAILTYLQILPKIRLILNNTIGKDISSNKIICDIITSIDSAKYGQIESELSKSLNAEKLPLLARDGNFIKENYHQKLDEYIYLVEDTARVILSLQSDYATDTGIQSLKIKHNNILGYFIEVSPKSADILFEKKEKFIHRQTIATSVRFTTTELAEMESKILNAKDKRLSLEIEIFENLCNMVLEHIDGLNESAIALANLDVFSSLANLAICENYIRPIIDDSVSMKIIGGRHPVVERSLKNKRFINFIDNDCVLQFDNTTPENSPLWLITGPNMAGKSTFLRQNAIIVLLAHAGFFVPATSAHIGVVDKLFSRVGASDNLATGQSTFMVEMIETAAILNKATEKSFVILDEIGRGTSTFDGMSIAYGVAEYLCEKIKCRGLFATHYHELTTIGKTHQNITCHTMQIKEWKGDVIFLYKIIPGIAEKSYGISVAKLAGIPEIVLTKAKIILAELEKNKSKNSDDLMDLFEFAKNTNNSKIDDSAVNHSIVYERLIKTLSVIDPDLMSPKDALEIIYELKNQLSTHAKNSEVKSD
ncbi:MAG: DNA mismatch repair protein MutS [Rickettsiales bacterium]|jgi:DNA mismatch repair protein MutS|nr:DNA mismatch repair protein MutS [Rickettsiales bacterium]